MIETYTVPDKDAVLCYDFAVKSVDSSMSDYVQRSQVNRQKVLMDIYTGKLAEMAICQILFNKGIKCSYPDFKVYTGFWKSFSADLKIENIWKTHVKSQHKSLAERFGLSWSFQSKDKIVSNPDDNDYIAMCLVDDKNVSLMHFKKAIDLVDKFSDPEKKELTTKKVIYYDHISNEYTDWIF